MATTLRIEGLFELKEELRNLPSHLRSLAKSIVEGTAREAAAAIVAAYPERTGNLKKGVRVHYTEYTGQYGVRVRVRNTAKHAFIFEEGTVARHNGIRATGMMPAGNVFIPRVIRYRRGMYLRLKQLLEGEGFKVQDDGG
jgi:hypothetical protein